MDAWREQCLHWHCVNRHIRLSVNASPGNPDATVRGLTPDLVAPTPAEAATWYVRTRQAHMARADHEVRGAMKAQQASRKDPSPPWVPLPPVSSNETWSTDVVAWYLQRITRVLSAGRTHPRRRPAGLLDGAVVASTTMSPTLRVDHWIIPLAADECAEHIEGRGHVA